MNRSQSGVEKSLQFEKPLEPFKMKK